jgi:hypothetical protein
MIDPTMTDDDKGMITVSFAGKETNRWYYSNDLGHRHRTLQALDYIDGWCHARAEILKSVKDSLDIRLNDHLCEMKPGCDDSILGLCEAWDIVRDFFKKELMA